MLQLDQELLRALDDTAVLQELIPLLRSNSVRLKRERAQLRIDGPDIAYHGNDPYLQVGLDLLGIGGDLASRQGFRQHGELFDLCLEDSWCGLFLSEFASDLDQDAPLNLIHLDDHTDMMSTLLVAGAPLHDPLTQRAFDPANPSHWPSAIFSGAVGIGSFLTPFFAMQRPVSVFHVQAGRGALACFAVKERPIGHPLLGDARFYAVHCEPMLPGGAAANRYLRGEDPAQVLGNLPPGTLAVHVDLDYFINDFNGNFDHSRTREAGGLQARARQRLDSVFDALAPYGAQIERWMVATSPGFCSGRHWGFLLSELRDRITQLA